MHIHITIYLLYTALRTGVILQQFCYTRYIVDLIVAMCQRITVIISIKYTGVTQSTNNILFNN